MKLTDYRPQTKFANVMFSQASVCPQRGCSRHWADTPRADTPPGRHTPWSDIPPVHAGIRSTSGRYASHWNTFLLRFISLPMNHLRFPVIVKQWIPNQRYLLYYNFCRNTSSMSTVGYYVYIEADNRGPSDNAYMQTKWTYVNDGQARCLKFW